MARRTGPGPRITEFARALGEHPMLVAAVHKVLMDTLPVIAALLEAEERLAAAPPAVEPPMTHWERQALKNAPPAA